MLQNGGQGRGRGLSSCWDAQRQNRFAGATNASRRGTTPLVRRLPLDQRRRVRGHGVLGLSAQTALRRAASLCTGGLKCFVKVNCSALCPKACDRVLQGANLLFS